MFAGAISSTAKETWNAPEEFLKLPSGTGDWGLGTRAWGLRAGGWRLVGPTLNVGPYELTTYFFAAAVFAAAGAAPTFTVSAEIIPFSSGPEATTRSPTFSPLTSSFVAPWVIFVFAS